MMSAASPANPVIMVTVIVKAVNMWRFFFF